MTQRWKRPLIVTVIAAILSIGGNLNATVLYYGENYDPTLVPLTDNIPATSANVVIASANTLFYTMIKKSSK